MSLFDLPLYTFPKIMFKTGFHFISFLKLQ